MKLGVVGIIPADFYQVDDAFCGHIRAMGFTGVGAHISGDPLQADANAVRHLSAVLTANGLRLVQFWGWYPSVVCDDDDTRAAGIRAAQEIIRLGSMAGADMIGIRPTSAGANGAWSPDGGNYTDATRNRLINSLREIAKACEQHAIPMALECHVTTALYSAAVVREVIERVGSPLVKMNMDPVNFVRDLPTAYHNTPLLNELFDELTPHIAAAHVKDVMVEDDHVVHIRETPPGTGLLDFDTFFRRFEAALPDGYALIEHLPPEKIPAAAAFVQAKLKDMGIGIRE
jgi:sugar phosphate isomerase/epimerase